MRWLLRHPSQGLFGKLAATGHLERWVRGGGKAKSATLFDSEEAVVAAWENALSLEAGRGGRATDAARCGKKGEARPVAYARGVEDETELFVWCGRLSDGTWMARVRGGGLEAVENFGQATMFPDPTEAREALGILLERSPGKSGALAKYVAKLVAVEGSWAEGLAQLEGEAIAAGLSSDAASGKKKKSRGM